MMPRTRAEVIILLEKEAGLMSYPIMNGIQEMNGVEM
jgi:hypothetical protein